MEVNGLAYLQVTIQLYGWIEKTQDGESVREGVQPLQQQKSENPKGYILMEKGFLGGSVIKDLPANVGYKRDACSIPRLGRSPGVGNGSQLQYSCLGNSMDRRAWWATVLGVSKSQTWLSTHVVNLLQYLLLINYSTQLSWVMQCICLYTVMVNFMCQLDWAKGCPES